MAKRHHAREGAVHGSLTHTLYAYVDGSDLRDVADAIERDLEAFAQSRTWKYGKAARAASIRASCAP